MNMTYSTGDSPHQMNTETTKILQTVTGYLLYIPYKMPIKRIQAHMAQICGKNTDSLCNVNVMKNLLLPLLPGKCT